VRLTRRDRALPLALAALSMLLALVQRPGLASSDTKIDLHTGPGRFLADVASVWTPTGGLGGVESAQYSGYLWPMGPFFAALHAIGVPDWLADRVWLGLLLAAGSWGVVRLADELIGRPRGVAHVAAALIYLLNPYVVVFSNRTTVTLLAYAALPWLVAIAYRGLRAPRGWRLPAACALILTSIGAGVNAAVVAFVLLGPALLAVFEAFGGRVRWAAVWSFGWRTAIASLVASLWWIAPVLAQGRYGIDFLRFTEPAGAIWATTSLTESLRLMGYWIAYIGVGFDGVVRPYFSDAGLMLFNPAVLVASLAVPGLALWGFAWTRRHRYAPFFLGLVLVGALLMTIGFPEGTPLRRAVTGAYNHLPSVRFLRTTYKAGPLVALGLAGLGGLAAAAVAERLRGRRWQGVAAAAVGAVLLALSAWPLVRGRAVDDQMLWDGIPAAWTGAARELDDALPEDERALVLPGQLYAFYRWGGTVDPILPSLSKRPVAVRNAVPYGDLHGVDLLWTTDALVQQERLVPGQLLPLLRLLGAGMVLSGSDDDHRRSGAADPAAAAGVLAAQGLAEPDASFGRRTRFPAPAGDLGPEPVLPEVRRYRVGDARPAVRVEPDRPAAVVDGSAPALAGLAAFGALRPDAIDYAGDLDAARLRAAAVRGSEVVVSDSNRRRVIVVSRLRQNLGATLGPADPVSEDAAVIDPFPGRGTAGQTVARLHGARSLRAPFSPGYSQFAEHRPFAAFDGAARTFWLADAALEPDRHWLEIEFVKPLDIAYVDVLPREDAGAVPDAIETGGRRIELHRGWNRLRLGLRGATKLRLLVTARDSGSASAGGLSEVRIPGLRVSESLRPPTLAEDALRGTRLERTPLTYLFERATGDRPFRRGSSLGSSPRRLIRDPDRLEALRVRDPGDAERRIDRVFHPPAARAWSADAWVSVSPEARDSELDRFAGGGAVADSSGIRAARADSSGRFQGRPAFRASAAFDGSASRPWIARRESGRRPWLRWSTARPRTIRVLTLLPSRIRVRRPTVVRLKWRGGRTGGLRVRADGRVRLPRPAKARTFRLEILGSAFPPGTTRRESTREAVAIGELRGTGMPNPRPGARHSVEGCGAAFVDVAGRRIPLRVRAPREAFEAGSPMRATACGPPARLPARQVRLRTGGRLFKVDLLRLRSGAPNPVTASPSPGRVVDTGEAHRASHDGVRLELHGPGLLVLGESYSDGWRAYCDGRSLGKPRVVDGYANAWPVRPPCTNVRFAFVPNAPVHWVQLFSALACLVLLAVALRHRRPADDVHARHADPAGADRALGRMHQRGLTPSVRGGGVPVRRALVYGAVAAVVLGFCFSLRAAIPIFVGVALITHLGIRTRPLAFAAGALLTLVVPALYLLFPAEDKGGYNPGYAGEHIAAHWVAVAAYTLLAVALVQVLSRASRASARARR
jgi:arabinofuranan 3-O-arabinosyltransferase